MTRTLFLPFTPKGRKTEIAAIEVKKRLGLGPYESVDPHAVLAAVPARIIRVTDLPAAIGEVLLGPNSDCWSAAGLGRSPDTGEELILVNPTHHPHRQKVSLMEEIVHVALDHPRVELCFENGGLWDRPYNADVEAEAFEVGAACIVPYRWLFGQIREGNRDLRSMAGAFAVSESYISYRIKRAGLYRMFRAPAASTAQRSATFS